MKHSAAWFGALRAAKYLTSSPDIFIILSSAPILLLLALAPETFMLTWQGFGKLGRGGLLFIILFLLWDWFEVRGAVEPHPGFGRRFSAYLLVSAASAYFGAMALDKGLFDFIYGLGRLAGAVGHEGHYSWLMALDYVLAAAYIAGAAALLFGFKILARLPVALIYAAGMATLYLLDAFFPFGSLGPLQFWVNGIVFLVTSFSRLMGLPVYGRANVLVIHGQYGFFRLAIYWPSAGVHSMLIYSLVLAVLIVKLASPMLRKVIYAVSGAVGTYVLNAFRITLISYYGYQFARTVQDLDAFHNVIGEVLFLIWIAAFLAVVLKIESAMISREQHLRE